MMFEERCPEDCHIHKLRLGTTPDLEALGKVKWQEPM